jgi:hypothetical protein
VRAVQARPAHLPAAVPIRVAIRVGGAALLLATAGIHLLLWSDGYRDILWIGPLFLLNAIGAAVIALAVLGAPARWLPLVCAAGALLELGTLGGLLLSTTVGFLGFFETWSAPWAVTSAVVESAGVLLLGGAALAGAATYRHRRARARL